MDLSSTTKTTMDEPGEDQQGHASTLSRLVGGLDASAVCCVYSDVDTDTIAMPQAVESKHVARQAHARDENWRDPGSLERREGSAQRNGFDERVEKRTSSRMRVQQNKNIRSDLHSHHTSETKTGSDRIAKVHVCSSEAHELHEIKESRTSAQSWKTHCKEWSRL